jgi:hypothetical protein
VALLAAVVFWLAQSSVEWIWQMPGVTLGAFLLLALALGTAGSLDRIEEAPARTEFCARPSDAKFHHRRGLDLGFRGGLAVLALALLLVAGLPYLSLRYQDMAYERSFDQPASALAAVGTAAALYPVDPQPLLVRAEVHRAIARRAAYQTGSRREIIESLSLALAANEQAIERDPASSGLRYLAALAALDLLAARDPAAAVGAGAEEWASRSARRKHAQGDSPLRTESGLAGPEGALGREPETGEGQRTLSLVSDAESERAADLLTLSDTELLERARVHLRSAEERDPLSRAIRSLLDTL